MKRAIWIGISIDLLIVALTLGYVFGRSTPKDIAKAEVISAPQSAPAQPPPTEKNQISKNKNVLSAVSYKIPNVAGLTESQLQAVLEKIAQCESEGNPYAKNPTSSAKGLLQILDGTWQNFSCDGNVFDPDDNMRCGMKIATESGLQHWNASKVCWIKHVSV